MAEHNSPRPDSGPPGEWRDEANRRTRGGGADGGWHAPHDDLDATDVWAAELRADDASRRRRREHWLRRQAADDASLTGVLVDLAEHGHQVRVTTAGGGHHVGRVIGAGLEVVVIDTGRARVFIRIDALVTVQAMPTTETSVVSPIGHRIASDPTRLDDLLSHEVHSEREVTLVSRSGEVVTGELISVGRDVVMVRPDRRMPAIYARLDSLSEAVLPLSTRSG